MIEPNCIPTNAKETVCELLGGPNKEGKFTFFLYWLTDYVLGCEKPEFAAKLTKAHGLYVRGQIFVADPAGYKKRSVANGRTWRVVDNRQHQNSADQWHYTH